MGWNWSRMRDRGMCTRDRETGKSEMVALLAIRQGTEPQLLKAGYGERLSEVPVEQVSQRVQRRSCLWCSTCVHRGRWGTQRRMGLGAFEGRGQGETGNWCTSVRPTFDSTAGVPYRDDTN